MVGDIGLGSGFGGERSGADVEYVEGVGNVGWLWMCSGDVAAFLHHR